MEELSELLLQRRRKVDALWEAGINPYPNDFRQLHTSADFHAAFGAQQEIPEKAADFAVAGRIIARRSFASRVSARCMVVSTCSAHART